VADVEDRVREGARLARTLLAERAFLWAALIAVAGIAVAFTFLHLAKTREAR
jgi:hypothetical protein